MTNEAKIRLVKIDGKDVSVGGPPEGKFAIVRNVWNSRSTVELQIGEQRWEFDAKDLETAIGNAMTAAIRG